MNGNSVWTHELRAAVPQTADFRIIQRKLLLDGCVRQGGYVGGGGGRAATGLTARAAERHLDHPMEPGPRFKRMNEKLSAERAHGLVLILSYRKNGPIRRSVRDGGRLRFGDGDFLFPAPSPRCCERAR